MARSVRSSAVVAALLVGGAFACQVVAGIERVDKVDRPPDAAPVDGGVDAPIPDPCEHAAPVPKPASDPAPGEQITTDFITMFISHTTADPTAPGVAGYDLDGVCTCDTREGTAHDGGQACVPPNAMAKNCDADGGVDNRVIDLVSQLGAGLIQVDDFTHINERIDDGSQTVLLFLRNYNGGPDDLEVEIGLVPSNGIKTALCDGSVPDFDGAPDGSDYSPAYCGDDTWTTPSGSLDNQGFPNLRANGYVNDGHLVVKLDRPLRIPFGDQGLELGSPILTGTIEPLDENLEKRDWAAVPSSMRGKRLFRIVDGTIAGRASASDVLTALGTFVVPKELGGTNGQHLCQSALFTTLKGDICGGLDIPRSSSFDFTAGFGCDAVSLFLGFRAEPGLAAGTFDEPGSTNDCAPEGTPPHAKANPSVVYTCP